MEMFTDNAEKIFFFAIHPKGVHDLIKKSLYSKSHLNLRKCKQLSPEDIHYLEVSGWSFFPFIVENEDQDFGNEVTDTSNCVTRFCCVFDTPYPCLPPIPDPLKCKLIFQTLKHLRNLGLVNSVEIAIWEDKPLDNFISLEDNLNGAIKLFLRSVSFVSEMARAATLQAGMKDIFQKGTRYDPEELFISVNVEVLLQDPSIYSGSLTIENHQDRIADELTKIAREEGKNWHLNSMVNPEGHEVFRLNLLFDYNRITAGIEIAGEASMFPHILNRSIDPAVAAFVIHVAEIKKGSIIADLNCGQGELLCAAMKRADCVCFGFETDKLKMSLAYENRTHLFKYLDKYSTSKCPVREMSLMLMTPLSVSFRFSHVTHVLCHIPAKVVRNATADELIKYYERVFQIISRASIATTILVVPRNHKNMINLSTEPVHGKLEYPFDVISSHDVLVKTDEYTVMKLQLNITKLELIYSKLLSKSK